MLQWVNFWNLKKVWYSVLSRINHWRGYVRLILVFWVFLGFDKVPGNITFLVTVLSDNLIRVLSFALTSEVWFGYVNSTDWGRVWIRLLIKFFTKISLFFFFFNLLKEFFTSRIFVWDWTLGFLNLRLEFMVIRVLHWVCLVMNLSYSCMNWTVFLMTIIVCFSNKKNMLETKFSLGFNSFLNNLF